MEKYAHWNVPPCRAESRTAKASPRVGVTMSLSIVMLENIQCRKSSIRLSSSVSFSTTASRLYFSRSCAQRGSWRFSYAGKISFVCIWGLSVGARVKEDAFLDVFDMIVSDVVTGFWVSIVRRNVRWKGE